MPYLIVCTFTNENGGNEFEYIAFSSEDSERPDKKVKQDILHQIGFQESFPQDKNTFHGYLADIIESACDSPTSQEGAIKCVIKTDRFINTSYPFLRVNDDYSDQPSSGQVRSIQHFYVQPNLNFNTEESDSDSDSSDD